MKVKFLGVPGEPMDEITQYGYRFRKGETVTVTDAFAKRKLANHPHFSAQQTADEIAEDATIKREFETVASLELKAKEAEVQANQQAEADQAKANAKAAEAEDAQKDNEVRSAADYQRMEEQPQAAPKFVD
jgi:hypothetical protein